jgi:hypothetical protein
MTEAPDDLVAALMTIVGEFAPSPDDVWRGVAEDQAFLIVDLERQLEDRDKQIAFGRRLLHAALDLAHESETECRVTRERYHGLLDECRAERARQRGAA